MMRQAKLCAVLLILGLCGYSLPERGFAWDYTQSTNFGVLQPGDHVHFRVTPPKNAQGKDAIVTKGVCDQPGGFVWVGGPASWNGTVPPDFAAQHIGRFSGEYGYPGTGGVGRALTWKMDTMGAVLKVDIEQMEKNVCSKMTSASLNLTSDSYLGDGTANWSSSPSGISGSGRSINFNPSSLTPATYVVTARSSILPSCRDTCLVRIIKVEIQPESFMDIGEGYKSGEFTADTGGATGNSYNWFAELPLAYEGGDILKNPELIQTDNKANIIGYWYAYPVDDPSAVCVWYVNCNVSFDDFTCKDETVPPGRLRVFLPNPGGKLQCYTGGSYNWVSEDGKYWATEVSMENTINAPDIKVPENSPFYNKIHTHEQKHYDDFTLSSSPITLGEEYLSDSSIWDRMFHKGITSKATTPCTSEDELFDKTDECIDEDIADLVPKAEERAYGVSDPMWPQYYYQNGQNTLDGQLIIKNP